MSTNAKKKYNHVEAFCLMTYRGEKTGRLETLWNSRDGVTPFTIMSKDRSEAMSHINFQDDKYAPDFIPTIGMRVFVDLPMLSPFAYVERYWHRLKHGFSSKKEAVEFYTKNGTGQMEGEPEIAIANDALIAALNTKGTEHG